MTILKIQSCFLFLSLLILISCTKESETPPRPIRQDGLWPLNFNNEWNYKRVFYKSDGSVESFSEEQTKITDTITVKGQLYFGNKTTGQFLTNSSPDAVRGIAMDSSLTDPFAIIFQRVFNNDTIIWRIDDPGCVNNQTFRGYTGVTVVNGFECIRNERLSISCNGTIRHREVFYLKPGLGLVKFEEYVLYPGFANAYLRVSVELLSSRLY